MMAAVGSGGMMNNECQSGGVDDQGMYGERVSVLEKQAREILASPARRLSEQSLQVLGPYLDEQIKMGTYNLEANMAILHLFSIHSVKYDPVLVRKILVKGISMIPSRDFCLYTSLLPMHMQELPEIEELIAFYHSIKGCCFIECWDDLEKPQFTDLAQDVNFSAHFRAYIINAISVSHSKISLMNLARLLRIDPLASELQYIIRDQRWVVTPPVNLAEAHPDPKKTVITITTNPILNKEHKTDQRSFTDTYLKDSDITSYTQLFMPDP